MWVLYGKVEAIGICDTLIWRNMRLPFNTYSEAVKASRKLRNNNVGWIPKTIQWEPKS